MRSTLRRLLVGTTQITQLPRLSRGERDSHVPHHHRACGGSRTDSISVLLDHYRRRSCLRRSDPADRCAFDMNYTAPPWQFICFASLGPSQRHFDTPSGGTSGTVVDRDDSCIFHAAFYHTYDCSVAIGLTCLHTLLLCMYHGECSCREDVCRRHQTRTGFVSFQGSNTPENVGRDPPVSCLGLVV
ncbi:hypothetical protein QBC40DRAFT_178826 [Triangularia verruculosa]|uniref:Uncharacterized protein n=1 Tax=Triangularia verruculosa TaxID=2587418 RepID=A0AAN6XF25_9PEZI|nr:hypothetical protein QBC40DRAFT_178826 [Triangularia verruculosa]